LIWLNANGEEERRTHHKRLDLAYARADVWDKNLIVVDETK